MKNYPKDIQLIAVKSYIIPLNQKQLIYEDNRNKSGIYCWFNIVTNKIYIGSSIMLNKRFSCYLSEKFLKLQVLRYKSHIHRSMLKYGYNNFNLYILEYCETDNLILREQYFIGKLDPEYNTMKIAASSLGFKHSAETLISIKRSIILKFGHTTIILNKKNGNMKKYDCIKDAAKDFNLDSNTIKSYIITGKLLKDTYIIIRFIKINEFLFEFENKKDKLNKKKYLKIYLSILLK